jgi:hypothetical protein
MAFTQDSGAREGTPAAQDVQVHEESRKLVITLDPQRPVPWSTIIEHTLPFMRCRETCVATTPDSPLPDAKATAHSPSSHTPEVTDELTAPFGLLDLPNELVTMIFMEAAEPYTLEAETLISLGIRRHVPKHLIFYAPRTWRAINLYQICRNSRAVAISLYGTPSPNSLPFNANMDKILICAQPRVGRGPGSGFAAESYLLEYQFDPEYTARGPSERFEASETPRRHQLFYSRRWTRDSGVYFSNAPRVDASHAIIPKRLSHSFLDRIQVADILLSKGSMYCTFEWVMLLHHLSKFLPRLQQLTVHTHQLDCCGHALWDLNEGERYYKAQDMWFLESMRMLPEDERNPARLFPNLSCFTISRVGSMCAEDMLLEASSKDDVFGEHLFPAEEGDDWSIDLSF